MEIKITDELLENGKSKDFIKYILNNCNYKLHFKLKDIKGELTKENVYNQLSINKLYNDDDQNIKSAKIDLIKKIIILEF